MINTISNKFVRWMLLIIVSCLVVPLMGEVKFVVEYIDKEGEGFHAHPEAKIAVEEVLADIGGWLDHEAEVRVRLVGTATGGLMSYNSIIKSSLEGEAFRHTPAGQKILEGNTIQGQTHEILININFEHEYFYGEEAREGMYDFKGTFLHEMTHGLGFFSYSDDICKESIQIKNLNKRLEAYGLKELFGLPIMSMEQGELRSDLIRYLHTVEDFEAEISEDDTDESDSRSTITQLYAKEQLLREGRYEFHEMILRSFYMNAFYNAGITLEAYINELEEGEYSLKNRLCGAHMFGLLEGSASLSDDTSAIFKALKEDINMGVDSTSGLDDEGNSGLEWLKRYMEFWLMHVFYGEGANSKQQLDALRREYETNEEAQAIVQLYRSALKEENINPLPAQFDKFLVNRKGENILGEHGELVKPEVCQTNSYKELAFRGDNTVKYYPHTVYLNGIWDPSHYPQYDNENEMEMKPISNIGKLEPREWCEETTAILMDLGYKVKNRHTEAWGLGRPPSTLDIVVEFMWSYLDILGDIWGKKGLVRVSNQINEIN